jgi:hypothetical protein
VPIEAADYFLEQTLSAPTGRSNLVTATPWQGAGRESHPASARVPSVAGRSSTHDLELLPRRRAREPSDLWDALCNKGDVLVAGVLLFASGLQRGVA